MIILVNLLADPWLKAKASEYDIKTMFGGQEYAYSAETVTFAVDETTQDYAVGG